MMKNNLLFVFSLLCFYSAVGQSESLTSSPYSLYGLGVINQTNIGKINAMGYTGIAMKPNGYINSLNPASYALIPQNNFLYSLGGKAEISTYENKSNLEKNSSFNFSNLAIAMPITSKIGVGLTLIPYSQVGYSLIGLETNIEGSDEVFESNVSGTGALNDFSLNIGYSPFSRLRLGLNAAVLFGNIEQEESFSISTSSFALEEKTAYSGLRLGLGTQIDLTNNISLGATVNLPTSLKGTLKRSTYKTLDYNSITIEDEVEDNTTDFELPLELGLGMSTRLFNNRLLLNVDYKKRFWDATEQSDHIGTYADQSIFGVGLEYHNPSRNSSYFKQIAYRIGYNADNGYLLMNNQKIDSYTIGGGIGLPISNRNNSMLNISYSYGQKGQIQNILVKEKYHMITIDLSLQDFWFVKRLID